MKVKGIERYREVLEERWSCFNAEAFIEADPLNVVYRLVRGERACVDVRDIEVGALFVAMIAWGNRIMIKNNALKLMELTNWHPYNYIVQGKYEEFPDGQCVHRTLFGKEFKEVCRRLRGVYEEYGSLEEYLVEEGEVGDSSRYVERLAKITAPARLGSVSGKSACKRLCMYMRWMVRRERPDLGLWRRIDQSKLFAVLDVHVVRQAKEQGLVTGTTASWRAVEELTSCYREWCNEDPLKYDMVMMMEDVER